MVHELTYNMGIRFYILSFETSLKMHANCNKFFLTKYSQCILVIGQSKQKALNTTLSSVHFNVTSQNTALLLVNTQGN